MFFRPKKEKLYSAFVIVCVALSSMFLLGEKWIAENWIHHLPISYICEWTKNVQTTFWFLTCRPCFSAPTQLRVQVRTTGHVHSYLVITSDPTPSCYNPGWVSTVGGRNIPEAIPTGTADSELTLYRCDCKLHKYS